MPITKWNPLTGLVIGTMPMPGWQNVGLITNPTGVDSDLTSTIDLVVEHEEEGGYDLVSLYGPEHGVRGGAPAGGYVENYTDPQTGLPVWSLYGPTHKPTPEMLEGVDTLLFDIQDIGTRFYTYIGTFDATAAQDRLYGGDPRGSPIV